MLLWRPNADLAFVFGIEAFLIEDEIDAVCAVKVVGRHHGLHLTMEGLRAPPRMLPVNGPSIMEFLRCSGVEASRGSPWHSPDHRCDRRSRRLLRAAFAPLNSNRHNVASRRAWAASAPAGSSRRYRSQSGKAST